MDRMADDSDHPEQAQEASAIEAGKALQERGVIPVREFMTALFDYLNMSIDDILASDNFVVRAFGMLDRRLGKRRLAAMDVSAEHPFVRTLHDLRCSAEGVQRRQEQQ